ncbi:D111/G-patch domain-containing protein [Tasmannia lanceolata]|uniref:D111/G-patch domain-containing protein n=1 Tax=Tasmannia lanceolata TaxID=3420 RepID=UPI0040647B1E
MGAGKKRSGKTHKALDRALFIKGGILSDWQNDSIPGKSPKQNERMPARNKSKKSPSNSFGYEYSIFDGQEGSYSKSQIEDSNSTPIVLGDSGKTQVVAYVDRMPCSEPVGEGFSYDYGSSSILGGSSHRGLGFCEDAEGSTNEEDIVWMGSNSSPIEKEMYFEKSTSGKERPRKCKESIGKDSIPKKNDGFLSIGGLKLYTEDISLSDEENDGLVDEDGDALDGEGLEPAELPCGDSDGSSDSECSEDTLSDSNSDIDKEVAEDYLEGIGGSSEFLKSRWLVGRDLKGSMNLNDSSEEDSSDSSSDGIPEKLGGSALQDASREYGMKKPRSRKKHLANTRNAAPAMDILLDDFVFVKDPRRTYGKKKQFSQLSQSWPTDAEKSKKFEHIPGRRKKHRKEMIAVKRRERMIRRGVDLDQINSKLRQMVLDEVDMVSFEPMHFRDCSQVQRLASIYRLQSGSQGSGKKRFVTVTRTIHTCMPSSRDKLRLDKLTGAGDEYADFTLNQELKTQLSIGQRHTTKIGIKLNNSSPSHTKVELRQSASSKLKNSANHHRSGEASGKKQLARQGPLYADQPVSFVSSGTMQVDPVDEMIIDLCENNNSIEKEAVTSSSRMGAFEMHTKGFGSKMMAKMGFIEGGGLGKDGRGIVEPIEAIQRPKSLGLGVEFAEAESSATPESKRMGGFDKMGGFEKHTKGFGSKMMAKMGFVEGRGLGKDGRGMITPIEATRRPKSLGLGLEFAEGRGSARSKAKKGR